MTARVAVLGLGSIGLRHARNFIDLGCSVAGFDVSEQQSAALSKLGGTCGSLESVVAKADLVVIASPTRLHLDHLRCAIEAGSHALVEKPLGHDGAACEALCADADARGRIVMPALNLRFLPVVARASALLRNGSLGEILWGRIICATYLPDYRPGTDYRQGYAADPVGGGVLYDIIHEFDLANYLMGPAETVAAIARNSGTLGLAMEDCADVLLRHERGVVSSLHLDYVTRPRRRITEIAGTEGVLQIDVSGRRLTMTRSDGTLAEDRAWEEPFAQTYVAEAAAALSAVNGREPFPIAWRDAVAVVKQVQDARRLSGLDETRV